MKYYNWIISAFLLCTFAANAQEKITITDRLAEKRVVDNFSTIAVSGGIQLFLTQDDKEDVVVSAKDEESRNRIMTKVVGNRLEIYFDSKTWIRMPDLRLKAYVSFKKLTEITGSGSSSVIITGLLKASDLDIQMSGASNLTGKIDVANSLTLAVKGSSRVTLNGKTSIAHIEASGASAIKAFDVAIDKCDAKASGASDINITVNKELNVEASGASSVKYKGDGVIKDIKSNGASSVKKM
jgi:hypothetical protein